MKKFLALVLSLAMVLSVCLMAGCGDTPEETTTGSTTTAETTTAESTKATEGNNQTETTTAQTTTGNQGGETETTTGNQGGETETTTGNQGGNTETTAPDDDDPISGGNYDYDELDGYMKLPGYEDIDFGGRVFVIGAFEGSDELGGGRWDNFREVYSDETDAISTSVRERNLIMEKNYNCKIEVHKSSSPGATASADVTGNQHTLDLYCGKGVGTGTYTNDNCYNLLNYGIDFSNPWWDQQFVNTFTLKKASGEEVLYAAVGDFSINAFAAVHLMFYNKDIYNRVLSDVDIYQLVRDHKWTMDKFIEILKTDGLAQDANGNSTYSYSEGDILSWVRTDQSIHGIQCASGLSIIDSINGQLSFACSDHITEWSDAISKAIDLVAVPQQEEIGYTSVQAAIEGGKALFASEVLDVLERMKDSDVAIGLVPYPLYSETQENYSHFVTTTFPSYMMPISVPDPDVIGDFFELYAYHSKYIVRKAFIDTYCIEYCGDEESAEMLDIILDSRTYDPGYVFWSGIYQADIGNMISSGKNNMTQWIGRKGADVQSKITEFITGISDNKN